MRKQASNLQDLASGAVQHAMEQLGGFKQIQERPFEILFKYIVPGLWVLKGKWMLPLLFGVAEKVLGFGPSTLGAWLDKAIGKGPGSGHAGPVSDSSLETASSSLVDRIVGGVFSKSSAFRTEIMKRGTIDAQALVVAWSYGPDQISKEAAGTLASKFRSLLGMGGYASKGLLSGALYQLLKALMIGVGVHTGVGMLTDAVGLGKGKAPAGSAPGGAAPAPGMRLYANPAHDVEKSLVMVLDNAVKDSSGKPFSRIFMDLKGYSPVGSQEMGRVLTEVQAAHGGASIQEIGGYRTFAAPPLAEVARMLLPQATYTRQTPTEGGRQPGAPGSKPPTEKEFESIFGGAR